MTKYWKHPFRYKLGGRLVRAETQIITNKSVEPTRSVRAMAARKAALNVARSARGVSNDIEMTSPHNSPNYFHTISHRRNVYRAAASTGS